MDFIIVFYYITSLFSYWFNGVLGAVISGAKSHQKEKNTQPNTSDGIWRDG